jgi:predicted homoserine dehydrogenase-like protein
MNLHRKLLERETAGRPVGVGLIGAGKFGGMFLAQVRRTRGMHLVGIADLAPARAAENLARIGWPNEAYAAPSLDAAAKSGATHLTDDAAALIRHPAVEVVIDATGSPPAGITHALLCCAERKHIVMVNVEADVLAGPYLAEEARKAGIVYSLAYGDQPALVCEMVDWARAAGFEVVAAGKGTKYLPVYHASTPETVWPHYGLTPERAAEAGMNPQMFNSFLDGTKSAIEMTAIANATGLAAPDDGLLFPPCGVDDLPRILKPAAEGGVLQRKGMVEVVSSLERDGRPVFRDLRWGVYVVFEAGSAYVERCFAEYGLVTDPSGRYAAMYKPYHLIGLELGISVASAALRGEATGAPAGFRADAVAVAKRDLKAGELLDGEGGYTVWGKILPAETSLARDALPIGLAHKVPVTQGVKAGALVRWSDVKLDETMEAVRIRRAMAAAMRQRPAARAAAD